MALTNDIDRMLELNGLRINALGRAQKELINAYEEAHFGREDAARDLINHAGKIIDGVYDEYRPAK